MGVKTKIDWCDATWNPVTGCKHGCEYCYARGIARRYGCKINGDMGNALAVLEEPYRRAIDGKINPYPYEFLPTYHKYRLDIPQLWTKPRTIFVCSMADLFGDWVPDEWIVDVLNACRKSPQHRYLFLTKNPERYDALEDADLITDADKNFWLGSTTTDITKDLLHFNGAMHTFQSCEPMLAPWPPASEPNRVSVKMDWLPEWVIFGAETGNRKGKVIPKKAWVDNAVRMCRNMGAKVFMKESLREIMGADFQQEYPWEE